jgi:uncharacterized protein (TIGR02246 family)
VATESEVLALFDEWNAALQTRDAGRVAELYAADAILLPTVSNSVRRNRAEIRDYFERFCARGPQGVIDEANVRFFGDIAINSGVYTFVLADGGTLRARFTFAYRQAGDSWEIVEHHSSRVPE